MKITKNMVYRPSIESDELYLFVMNEVAYYENIKAIIKSLSRKWRKGVYDSEKAVICYYRIASMAAKSYDLQFGSPFHKTFTVTDRWSAAVELEERFREDVEENAA